MNAELEETISAIKQCNQRSRELRDAVEKRQSECESLQAELNANSEHYSNLLRKLLDTIEQ